MVEKKCPFCLSFFFLTDKRKKYCNRRCKENARKYRARLLKSDNRIRAGRNKAHHYEKETMMRSIRESRKATIPVLEKQVAYLKKRNEELQHELEKHIQQEIRQ